MIEKCQTLISEHKSQVEVSVRQADIVELEIETASLVVMNFTLQFIAEGERQTLVNKIYAGMNKGGAFLLSEKIKSNNEAEENRLISLHHAFKKANGYSDLEISQKRSSLEQVLLPETVEQHIDRLNKAGFSEVMVWFQCFNFVSLLAIK